MYGGQHWQSRGNIGRYATAAGGTAPLRPLPPSPPRPASAATFQPPPCLPPQVNSKRIFSDRQATDLLKTLSGEISLLLLPSSPEALATLREHLLAAAANSPSAVRTASRCLEQGLLAPLVVAGGGAYYLQPISMPEGLTLPPGCQPGGCLMYLTPLPAADGSFPPAAAAAATAAARAAAVALPAARAAAAALPAAALPGAALPAAALPAAASDKRETAAEAHGSGGASVGSAFRPARVLNASSPPPTRSPMRPGGATHSRTRSGDHATLTRYSGEVRGDAARAAAAGQRTAECFVMGEACAAPSRAAPAPAAPFAEGRTAHAVIEDDVLEQSLDNSMDLTGLHTGCLVRPV